MALSDEKSVLLISNCKSVTEEENTLTSFSGSIPLKYLDENKTWFVALHSCGLHLNVKQTLCPKSKHHPSLMHITWKDYSASVLEHSVDDVSKLPLGMFEDRHKLFIDREKSYSPESLVKEIEREAKINMRKSGGDWNGFPLKYDRALGIIVVGQFESNGEDSETRISKLVNDEAKQNARTIVFMSENFKKGLDIKFAPGRNFKSAEIDGETYYYFYNSFSWRSAASYPFKSKNSDFSLNVPKIIQIVSPNIEHSINNYDYKQCLRQFTVKKTEIKKYVHKEFKNLEFFEASDGIIDRIEVKFADETFQQMSLGQGLPSWIKLVFTSMMDNSEHVRISSESTSLHHDNTVSDFSVELPRQLDFTWKKNPKVALTRISIKNKWKLMPGLRISFLAYNVEDNTSEYFECPRDNEGPRTCEEIVLWFENQIRERVEVHKLPYGNLSLIFKKPTILIIGRDLGQCMGFSFSEEYGGNAIINVGNIVFKTDKEDLTNITKAVQEYNRNLMGVDIDVNTFLLKNDVIISASAQGSKLVLKNPPADIDLFPNDLYIYASIVEPTVVVGEYRRLLRIIPLPHNEKDQNITVEFPTIEFHSLSELKPKVLHFEIVTIDGRPAEPFNSGENVYLNLQFVHE